jgi:transposase
MKERRRFSREFKLAAVKKVVEDGMSVAEVSRDLGLSENLLHTWKRKLIEAGAVSAAPADSPEEELQRLREENRRLKMERDILKKATAFFANEKD